jgi:hypothetical protein
MATVNKALVILVILGLASGCGRRQPSARSSPDYATASSPGFVPLAVDSSSGHAYVLATDGTIHDAEATGSPTVLNANRDLSAYTFAASDNDPDSGVTFRAVAADQAWLKIERTTLLNIRPTGVTVHDLATASGVASPELLMFNARAVDDAAVLVNQGTLLCRWSASAWSCAPLSAPNGRVAELVDGKTVMFVAIDEQVESPAGYTTSRALHLYSKAGAPLSKVTPPQGRAQFEVVRRLGEDRVLVWATDTSNGNAVRVIVDSAGTVTEQADLGSWQANVSGADSFFLTTDLEYDERCTGYTSMNTTCTRAWYWEQSVAWHWSGSAFTEVGHLTLVLDPNKYTTTCGSSGCSGTSPPPLPLAAIPTGPHAALLTDGAGTWWQVSY